MAASSISANRARSTLETGCMGLQEPEASALRYHGGNLAAARRLFPHAPEPWIDLSTGITPVPYPVGQISNEAWTRLPDATALEASAHATYAANPATGVVAAPGAQALIQLL